MTEPCKWCGEPSVDTITVEPAKYATVAKTDPMTGEVLRGQECTQLPITAPVCATHLTIGEGPGSEIKTPAKTTAKGVDQGSLFDAATPSAIFGADR